jgi:hypothetical protein
VVALAHSRGGVGVGGTLAGLAFASTNGRLELQLGAGLALVAVSMSVYTLVVRLIAGRALTLTLGIRARGRLGVGRA